MATTAILFDIDGTLVDSNALHVDAWHQTFAENGHRIAKTDIALQIGKGGDQLVPSLLPEATKDQIERYGKRHDELFRKEALPGIKAFPKARDLLQHAAARGMRLVLASSANQKEIDHYVQQLDLGSLLACTTSGDDVQSSKPAPDIFALALRKLGDVNAADVAVVGDTPYDMMAARKIGLDAIAVRSGGCAEQVLHDAGARIIADDVADVLRRFEELFGR